MLVPLRRSWTFDQVRSFARGVAEVLVEREPDLLTLEARKDKRGDRVLIDIQRNGYGQTAVPPYAVRARPRAPVVDPDPLGRALAGAARPVHDPVDRSTPRTYERPVEGTAPSRRRGSTRQAERLQKLRV